MKTKNLLKKAFLLLALIGGASSAWGAVTDLAFTATKTVTAGGEIWWTTSTNVATATTAGWCTKNTTSSNNKYGDITPKLSGDVTGDSHKVDGVQVKGGNTPSDFATSKKALVFKVTNTTAITAYGTTTSSNGTGYLRWSIYDASDNSAVVSSAYGDGASTNSTCTITKSGLSASKTYIVFIEGGFSNTSGSNQDVVVYAIKFAAPNAGAPTINTQPVSANYETGASATALSVSATASSGELSYQWYSNTSETTEGATTLTGQTSSSYTPSTSSAGTTYYYCAVTDGNGTTNSNFATIGVVGALTPTISYEGTIVTITYEGGGKVYYTIDGTVPSDLNGTEYSTPFSLTDGCTVRAIAIKGGNSSELAKRDCYVKHATALAVLNYNGGSTSEKTWTSDDGLYTLTASVNNLSYTSVFSSQDGFKMNASGDVYTLTVDADVKVTSIKVVGRTWLNGAASTLAITGFTPNPATFIEGEEGHISYIKTVAFTPSSELPYGASITITPSDNQFGGYIEIYGTKRSVPADPEAVAGTTVTWDFTSSSVGTVTASTSNTLSSTSGTSMNITYIAGSGCSRDNTDGLKAGGKTNVSSSNWTDRYFVLQIAKSGTLSITSGSNYGEYKIYKGASSTFSSATSVTTITTTSGGTASANISYDSSNPYIFIGFTDAKRYTKNISWTPVTDDITLTTSANMAGWRAFYDASNGYTLDANTKAYIATDVNDGVVKMKPINDVPSGTPVILKTTSSADNYKMTLTKASLEPYENLGNLLTWDTGAVSNKYRLGYGAEGVGFYPYSGTPSSGAVILNVSSNQARSLRIVFGGEITDINEVKTEVKAAKDGKFIENGKLVIFKNGKKFNAAGAKLY